MVDPIERAHERQVNESLTKAPDMEQEKWKIRIAGYGTFDFNGTEAEAEDMRSGKAQWEHGSGIKWCVSNPTEVDKLTELMAWYFENRSGCPPWLFKARAKAIKEAKDA